MQNKILFISILILAGLAGFHLQRYIVDQDNQNLAPVLPETTASVVGQQRPEFGLTDTEGEMRKISEWNGKVLLVNFWATWCPPCKKEIPAFMALQDEYGEQGFQVIGIAIDDEQAVIDYADTLGINYPIMAAELTAMEISRLYGNRFNALPYSVFVARDGTITHTKPGELTKQQVEDIIKPLLARQAEPAIAEPVASN